MVRKLFKGVHQARVDVDTAAKVIGYASSGSGAASSALGALRQFGLVDGLRGDMAVSDLAMRIIQPMSEDERIIATREAATKPEIFSRLIDQFGRRLPAADEPIRAYLIRQEGFSTAGANELIKTLRETMASLPEEAPRPSEPAREDGVTDDQEKFSERETALQNSSTPSSSPTVGELISLPLGQNSKAELRLIGEITAVSYARLIRHLELLREMAEEEI